MRNERDCGRRPLLSLLLLLCRRRLCRRHLIVSSHELLSESHVDPLEECDVLAHHALDAFGLGFLQVSSAETGDALAEGRLGHGVKHLLRLFDVQLGHDLLHRQLIVRRQTVDVA